MAANSSPKTVLQCTLTTISTWSAAQSQSWLRHLVCLFPNFDAFVQPRPHGLLVFQWFLLDISKVPSEIKDNASASFREFSFFEAREKVDNAYAKCGGGGGANKVYWGRCENCEQTNFYILKFILAANKAELWQWRRRYKNDFASFKTLSRLFGPAQFVICRRFFPELNF